MLGVIIDNQSLRVSSLRICANQPAPQGCTHHCMNYYVFVIIYSLVLQPHLFRLLVSMTIQRPIIYGFEVF